MGWQQTEVGEHLSEHTQAGELSFIAFAADCTADLSSGHMFALQTTGEGVFAARSSSHRGLVGKGGGTRLVPAPMLRALVSVRELQVQELSPICPCTHTTMGFSGCFF